MASCKILVAGERNSVGECIQVSHAKLKLILECRASASTVLSVTYDLPTISCTNDPIVVKINEFADIGVDYAHPGNYLVEFFTWMKYIPPSVAEWKRLAEARSKYYSAMFVGMFRDVGDRIVKRFICFTCTARSSI